MTIEVKKSAGAKLRRGFYSACEDLRPTHRFLVHSHADEEAYPVGDCVTAMSLRSLVQHLSTA